MKNLNKALALTLAFAMTVQPVFAADIFGSFEGEEAVWVENEWDALVAEEEDIFGDTDDFAAVVEDDFEFETVFEADDLFADEFVGAVDDVVGAALDTADTFKMTFSDISGTLASIDVMVSAQDKAETEFDSVTSGHAYKYSKDSVFQFNGLGTQGYVYFKMTPNAGEVTYAKKELAVAANTDVNGLFKFSVESVIQITDNSSLFDVASYAAAGEKVTFALKKDALAEGQKLVDVTAKNKGGSFVADLAYADGAFSFTAGTEAVTIYATVVSPIKVTFKESTLGKVTGTVAAGKLSINKDGKPAYEDLNGNIQGDFEAAVAIAADTKIYPFDKIELTATPNGKNTLKSIAYNGKTSTTSPVTYLNTATADYEVSADFNEVKVLTKLYADPKAGGEIKVTAGTYKVENDVYVVEGAFTATATANTKDGYTFKGWFLDSTHSQMFQAGATLTLDPIADGEYYAFFENPNVTATPTPLPTSTPTVAPGEPTPTTAPGEPTPTTAPGEPTPTTAPGEPTPTVNPEEPTPTPTAEPTDTPDEPEQLDVPTGINAKNAAGGVKVYFNKVKNAVEYSILRDGEEVGTADSSPYVDKTAKEGKTYTYSVIAIGDGEEYADSDESATKKICYLKKPVISSINRYSKRKHQDKMKVKFAISTKVDGYEVKYAPNKKLSSATKDSVVLKTVQKKEGIVVKGLDVGNKSYYFKIRSYKVVDGKKYYSAWSAVKGRNIKRNFK